MTLELADDPHDRLVDVLLEESLRPEPRHAALATMPTSPRLASGTRWFAFAAALLGLSAVVATRLLRAPQPAVAPVQQPQDPQHSQEPSPTTSAIAPWLDGKQLAIGTDAELRALAPEFVRLRVRMVKPRVEGGAPQAILGAEEVVDDRTAVRALVASLPTASEPLGSSESLAFDTWIAFELADGRHVDGLMITQRSLMHVGSLRIDDVGDAVRTRVDELVHKAAQNLRISIGIAENKEQLARVPATSRAIRCGPPDNGAVGELFARFAQLEHLELTHTYTLGSGPIAIQPPNHQATVLRELQIVPNLRHLRMPGYLLGDDERFADLAALPKLTSLRVDGPFPRPARGSPGLRALAAKLTRLELVAPSLAADDLEPFVAAGRLQTLILFGDPLPPATLARIAQLPSLTTLSLGGEWNDEHLRALANSKITVLRLEHSDATIDGIQQLPRSLRLLDLQRQGFLPKQREALAGRWPASIAVGRGFAPEPADSPFVDPFAGFGTTRR